MSEEEVTAKAESTQTTAPAKAGETINGGSSDVKDNSIKKADPETENAPKTDETVNAEEENAPSTAETITNPSEQSPVMKPKKRGRKSKKELQEIAEAEARAKGKDKTNAPASPAVGPKEAGATVGKRGRKPKVKVEEEAATDVADGGEETESEPEKQPKKRAKLTTAKVAKKTPGRKKKQVAEEEDSDSEESEGEEEIEIAKGVETLPAEIKDRYGEIAWVKMGGYPYWPALILDPRRASLNERLTQDVLKGMDTKYLVFFYYSKSYVTALYKHVERWDDTKFNYRDGYPLKESKAPKRRAQLMQAIEEADKDILLPIEERMDGLFKPKPKKVKKKAKPVSEPTPVKRKPGRPPGSKTKNKTGKPGRPKKAKEGADATVELEEDEDEAELVERSEGNTEEDEAPAVPALSKEEIKAKVASRKTPSKKKNSVDAGTQAASGKKTTKSDAKGSSKSGAAPGKSASEIDSKRKKEIELVVPRKSVKSSDIREMTEEAAKKKLGVKEKVKKDKIDYKVGDLSAFASKLTRLHANESSKNNDEAILMLTQLFDEKLVYRSDVERSGLAAIIALLRKSTNPTVAQTASAIRKHLMKILCDDTTGDKPLKKNKASTDDSEKVTKKRKIQDGENGTSADKKQERDGASSTMATNGDPAMKEKKPKTTEQTNMAKKDDAASSSSLGVSQNTKDNVKVAKENEAKQVSPSKASQSSNGTAQTDKLTTETAVQEPVKDETASTKEIQVADQSSKSLGSTINKEDDVFKGEMNMDKNRLVFVEMLSKTLEPNGKNHKELAKEIEEFVFDRYKESNEDYKTQARMITFGLKGNETLRQRLFSGSLHGLELVYADDEFFKAS